MKFLQEFINKWFWQPKIHQEGYNVVDTTVYSLIFVLAVFLVYKYFLKPKLKKKEICFDKTFMIALCGWVLSASGLRVLRDLNFYETYWLVSPGISFVIFIPCILTLFLSLKLGKKQYYKLWGLVGYAFAFFNILKLPLNNIPGFVWVISIISGWIILFSFLKRKFSKFLTSWNLGAIYAHLFDATATFVAMQFFGFRELHILPTFLINQFGPWIMFPLKLSVVPLVLYLIDKYSENENDKKYLKIIIIILGLATGSRDLLLLLSS